MFEALGQAPIVAGDRVRARERALDEALRQAVEQATATVLEPTELVARASDLKLRIYPKAKCYVATYRILDEGEQPPGTFQVHLSAAVATARLARDLSAATAHAADAGAAAQGARRGVRQRQRRRRRRAGGGREGAARAGRRAQRRRRMPGPQPCDPARRPRRWRAAAAAQAALSAEVQVTPGGDIRGTTLVGADARAAVKLVEPDGRVSAAGDAERGGYAPSPATRPRRRRAPRWSRRRARIEPALAQRWSTATPAGPAGGVTVRVRGVERWAEYTALTRALGALPGVAAVEPRRFVRGEIDLARAHRVGGVAAGRHT